MLSFTFTINKFLFSKEATKPNQKLNQLNYEKTIFIVSINFFFHY
jgi:hypothetical protein